MRILMVEDKEDISSSMGMLFDIYGHDWIVRDNGHDAIESALTFKPNLVLLDINIFGEMNGWDVCRKLRNQSEFVETIICAITGYGSPEDFNRSHQAGINKHFVKPVLLSDIVAFLLQNNIKF